MEAGNRKIKIEKLKLTVIEAGHQLPTRLAGHLELDRASSIEHRAGIDRWYRFTGPEIELVIWSWIDLPDTDRSWIDSLDRASSWELTQVGDRAGIDSLDRASSWKLVIEN